MNAEQTERHFVVYLTGVVNLEHILHHRLDEMDYTNSVGLEHKICHARYVPCCCYVPLSV